MSMKDFRPFFGRILKDYGAGNQGVEFVCYEEGAPYEVVGLVMEVKETKVRLAFSAKGGIVVDEGWFELAGIRSVRMLDLTEAS